MSQTLPSHFDPPVVADRVWSGEGTPPGRVLLTGAAGKVGRHVREYLRGFVPLRSTDILPLGEPIGDEEVVTCDLTDKAATRALMEGVSDIVHLAGIPRDANVREIAEANVIATWNLYEAAREAGVRRVVLGSSNHSVGFYPVGEPLDSSTPARADGIYGASKAFQEIVGRLFWDKHGLETACIRIGSVLEAPTSTRHLSTWISHRDLGALIWASLTAETVQYSIAYGASDNERTWWSDEIARSWGYAPLDRSETYAAQIAASSEDANDPAQAFQGGPWAASGYTAPSERLELVTEATQAPRPVMHSVPSATRPELDLALREVRAIGRARRHVLLVGSYGMPTSATFDIEGASLMRDLSQKGVHCWALDLLGYGAAGRPVEMNDNAEAHPALGRAAESADDLEMAARYIAERAGVSSVDVIGWSWGGAVAGTWAATNPELLGRLVLLASPYSYSNPAMAAHFADPVYPAYDVVAISKSLGQWLGMLDQVPASREDLVEDGVVEHVTQALQTCDPGFRDDGAFRRPSGPKLDLAEIWKAQPVYDIARVTVPTLSVHGTHDPFVEAGQLDRLDRAVPRREVVIADATHYLLFERCRDQVSDEITRFLLDATIGAKREEMKR